MTTGVCIFRNVEAVFADSTLVRMIAPHSSFPPNASTLQEIGSVVMALLHGSAPVGTAHNLIDTSRYSNYEISQIPLTWSSEELNLVVVNKITQKSDFAVGMHAERGRMEQAIRAGRLCIMEWNLQSGEILINEYMEQVLGYAPGDFGQMTASRLEGMMHRDDMIRWEIILGEHLRGRLDYFEVEVRLKHIAGGWVWVFCRACISRWDSYGRPIIMSGAFVDVTEKKRYERELFEANERLALSLKELSSLSHAHPGRPNGSGTEGIRVLYVEDVASNRLLVETALEDTNISCVAVSSGMDALQRAKNEKFDVILMDMQMPGMDGYQTAKLIRTQQGGCNVTTPVMAFTAEQFSEELADKLARHQIQHLLHKPFDIDDLIARIATISGK
jgi:PAS domain S-box-containing protein